MVLTPQTFQGAKKAGIRSASLSRSDRAEFKKEPTYRPPTRGGQGSFFEVFFMLVLSSLLALTLSFVLTPAVIGFSWCIGAVDIPCDGRRMHCQSIPRAGGIAIFSAFAVALAAGGRLTHDQVVILCGGGLMLLVGLADDVFCLGAWTKLFFQIAAALRA